MLGEGLAKGFSIAVTYDWIKLERGDRPRAIPESPAAALAFDEIEGRARPTLVGASDDQRQNGRPPPHPPLEFEFEFEFEELLEFEFDELLEFEFEELLEFEFEELLELEFDELLPANCCNFSSGAGANPGAGSPVAAGERRMLLMPPDSASRDTAACAPPASAPPVAAAIANASIGLI